VQYRLADRAEEVTMVDDDGRLGGAIARRPLHLIWLLDVSGSMAADGKMQALNVAVREAAPHLEEAARTNPGAQLLVRALAFGSSVHWVIPEPTPIEQFKWRDLHAEPRGLTELGSALRELSVQMKALAEDGRGFAPAIVLVSDGQPTDTVTPSFRAGMEELRAEPWGEKAIRLAVAIGRDTDLGALRQFIGRGELEPFRADSPEQLADTLRFVSTIAVRAASTPGSPVLPATLAPPPAAGPVW
jgi:uncharacterized protein YegL